MESKINKRYCLYCKRFVTEYELDGGLHTKSCKADEISHVGVTVSFEEYIEDRLMNDYNIR